MKTEVKRNPKTKHIDVDETTAQSIRHRPSVLAISVILLFVLIGVASYLFYNRLDTVLRQVAGIRNNEEVYQFAEFRIGEKGYQRIDATGGTFFLSVQETAKDAQGYMVKMVIGNPQQAAYHGGSFRWRLGRSVSDPSQEVKFEEVLTPGSWTTITFRLPVSAGSEVKEFSIVDFKTPRVSLQRPTPK